MDKVEMNDINTVKLMVPDLNVDTLVERSQVDMITNAYILRKRIYIDYYSMERDKTNEDYVNHLKLREVAKNEYYGYILECETAYDMELAAYRPSLFRCFLGAFRLKDPNRPKRPDIMHFKEFKKVNPEYDFSLPEAPWALKYKGILCLDFNVVDTCTIDGIEYPRNQNS